MQFNRCSSISDKVDSIEHKIVVASESYSNTIASNGEGSTTESNIRKYFVNLGKCTQRNQTEDCRHDERVCRERRTIDDDSIIGIFAALNPLQC